MANQWETLTFQFDIIKDESSYHLKNEPGEIQRQNVIDDLCAGLLLQSHIIGVVHGKLSPNGDPGTLVVMNFVFHGQNHTKRFQQAEIIIRFADEKRPLESDPELCFLWPEGDFSFSESEATVNQTVGIGVNAGGQVPGLSSGVTGNWTCESQVKQTDVATLKGAKQVRERCWGKDNAVRLFVQEK